MPLPYKDFAKTKAKVTHCKTRLEPDLGVSCLKKVKKDSFYRVTKRVFRCFHSSLTCTHHVWCRNTCFSPWCALEEGRQSCHTSRPCWCHGNGTNHCTLQAQSQKSAEEKKKNGGGRGWGKCMVPLDFLGAHKIFSAKNNRCNPTNIVKCCSEILSQ